MELSTVTRLCGGKGYFPQMVVRVLRIFSATLATLIAWKTASNSMSKGIMLAATIPLIGGNLCPLSFVDVPECELGKQKSRHREMSTL